MFTSLAFFLTIVHRYAEDYGIYANKIEKNRFSAVHSPMIGERGRRKRGKQRRAENIPYFILEGLLIIYRSYMVRRA